jgi:peptidoglycan/LPS O-acetylase OafA/YrhL
VSTVSVRIKASTLSAGITQDCPAPHRSINFWARLLVRLVLARLTAGAQRRSSQSLLATEVTEISALARQTEPAFHLAERPRPDPSSLGDHGFRTDVEGLRALAVLLVVLFHLGIPTFSGGFVGVDVFFVISGYLITALLCREMANTGSISILAFLARRMRRLLPVAAVVFVATLILSAAALPPLQLSKAASSVRAATAYVSNVHFFRLASDYFSGDVKSNPVLHTWSLSVEEQFYFIWPWIILLALGGGKQPAEANRRRLGWALAVIGSLSFAFACRYTASNQSLAFYATHLRAWEFASGGLASLVATSSHENTRPLLSDLRATAAGWIGFALIVFSSVTYSSATEFPGASALVPVFGTSLLLVAGDGRSWFAMGSVGRILSSRPAQWIGKRSYGWYLWHWPILVLGLSVFPRASIETRMAFVGAALMLAAFTYRFIESPARRDNKYSARAEPTIILGLGTSLVVLGLASVTRWWADVEAHGPAQRTVSAAVLDIPAVYRDRCVNAPDDERVRVCEYGPPSATTIALFGDSHAAQWFPALDAVARQRHWRILFVAKTRCATADIPVFDLDTGRRFNACERWRDSALDTLLRRRPTVIVLSNATRYIGDPRRPAVAGTVTASAWRAGLARTLDQFGRASIPVLLIRDTPLLAVDVPFCLARVGPLSHAVNSCASDRSRSTRPDVLDAEWAAISTRPGNRLVDLTDQLCQPSSCQPTLYGRVAYKDREHLTATVAATLAPYLATALDDFALDSKPNASRPSRGRPSVQPR